MSEGRVTCQQNGDVARVTFDRPEARNALTWTMYQQLSDVLDEIESAAALRVAVFRGAGQRAFVAGTDIRQFTRFQSVEDGLAYERFIDRLMARVEALPVATIAVVEGYAVGGGLALAAACDLRICTPDAMFGVPIARTLGNCLSMRNYARLVALLGPGRASRMILTAELLNANEARHAGFVLEIVTPEQLEDSIKALGAALIRSAPITLRVSREMIQRITARGIPDGDDLLRQTYGSEDFREGVAAFVARRQPVWKGM